MFHRQTIFLLAVCAASPALADIYKCVDEAGRTTYTNDKPSPGLKCTLMSREQPVTTVTLPKAAPQPTPSSFPRVDDSTQKARDQTRRQILEKELADEEKLLDTARKELTEQEAVRMGDEKNFQKLLDRVQPYKDKVALHERNIEAIRKEIANLR